MIPIPELNLAAVAPLTMVAIGAFLVLGIELFLNSRKSIGRPVTGELVGSALALVSAGVLAATLAIATSGQASGEAVHFNPDRPLIRLDAFANHAIAALSVGAGLVSLLSVQYLRKLHINHGEYYALLLLSVAGMVLLVSAVDLLSLFLGLEIMSLPLYVLAGFDRRKLRSNEASLKYFLAGSFATAFMLYGMALLYGATGGTHYDVIRAGIGGQPVAWVGVALVVAGFAAKIASVPFHQWAPDVYEGAPTTVTAFVSVAVKFAAFAAFLRFTVMALGPITPALSEVLWALAALTLVIGSVMTAVQENLKRLLAYSGIVHAGTLLVAFAAASDAAWAAVLFYLTAYVFMNLGAFAVVVTLAGSGEEAERIDDLSGLARSHPALAAAMTLFLLSLAGIPGTAGFIAKFQLLLAAVDAGQVGLSVVAVLASVVASHAYLRIALAMYTLEPGTGIRGAKVRSNEALVLGVCVIAVLLLGVFPNESPFEWLSGLRALDWSAESIASLGVR